MRKIFISYRRSDSLDATGRICDHLSLYFGEGVIFRDIDAMSLGDFTRQLTSALQECAVILAIIGPHWLDAVDQGGNRRIDLPDDFVQREITAGFEKGVPVVPVIVGGGQMPSETQLPLPLGSLARQQAFEVRSGRDFAQDIAEFSQKLSSLVGLERLEFRTLLQSLRQLGLAQVYADFSEDTSALSAIALGRDLLVVMNDGRSWLASKRESIEKRLKDNTKRTRILLLHPRSPFLETLVRKNQKTVNGQIEEIRRSYNIINGMAVDGTNIEIRGHFLFNPSTLILTESQAFCSPYYYMESGALPLYKFTAGDDSALYYRIRQDAEQLFAASPVLTQESFP